MFRTTSCFKPWDCPPSRLRNEPVLPCLGRKTSRTAKARAANTCDADPHLHFYPLLYMYGPRDLVNHRARSSHASSARSRAPRARTSSFLPLRFLSPSISSAPWRLVLPSHRHRGIHDATSALVSSDIVVHLTFVATVSDRVILPSAPGAPSGWLRGAIRGVDPEDQSPSQIL